MKRYPVLAVGFVLAGLSLGQTKILSEDLTETPTSHLKAAKAFDRQSRQPDQLVLYLGSPDAQERGMAALALARIGPRASQAIPALSEMLNDFANFNDSDGVHTVSIDAARAIRAIDPNNRLPTKAIVRLVRAASEPAERRQISGGWVSRCGAQKEALATLEALGPLVHDTLPAIVRLNHMLCAEGAALQTALALGSPASEDMRLYESAMNHPDEDSRRSVVEYLGEARVSSAASLLGRAMNDPSPAVRLATVAALERIHPEGEGRLAMVAPYLAHEAPVIRRQALGLLTFLAPQAKTTRALLTERLKDTDPSIVLACARLIAQAWPSDAAYLMALVGLARNADTDTGFQAAQLLKTSGSQDPRVLEALDPFRMRERQELIEKALSSSTPEERSVNARLARVNRIRVAKEIRREEPFSAGQIFAAKTRKLYCWTEVSASRMPAEVHHVWIFEGKPVLEAALVLPSARNVVWSSRSVRPGKWRVEVRAPGSSSALAAASFTVSKP